ncbi:MAG TPA: hypothetical protein PK971_16740, partial [Saprospiraceae bacterium]|nr:hypothetical protein [Saprospiraceae bacterium]
MRKLLFCLFSIGLLLNAAVSAAQDLIYAENFNICALPAGWQVKSQGNPNPVWYVGICTNDDAQGQSIDGSCFLMIDDDATGDSTQAYVLDIISPPFDASQHSAVYLLADIHYRDWYEGQEKFQVLVTDGTTETLISTFDRQRSNGEFISDVFKLRYDLALVTNSANA